MQKKDKITYKKVEKMIGKLITTAQKPTVQKLKKILGQKTSELEIKTYLSKWKDKQKLQHEFIRITKIKEKDINKMTREQLKEEMVHRTKDLEKSLSLVKATLESTADGILMVSKRGAIVDWNHQLAEIFNMPADIVKSKDERRGLQHVLNMTYDPQALINQLEYLYDHPEIQGDMGEMPIKNGHIIARYSQPHIVGKRIVGRVWSFRDVTERKRAEEELRLRERAIEASTHGVMITEAKPSYKILYVNPALTQITGYSKEELMGKDGLFLKAKEQTEIERLSLALKEQREDQAEFQAYRKDGKTFWSEMHIAPVRDPEGDINHFVAIMVDISERKKMEEQLIHQATHDFLTDLPNRALLLDRIQQAIINANRAKTIVGILFIDLDRFKLVNDSLGHDMGDKLLNCVSNRLVKSVRDSDTVARLGGDEFVIVSQFLQNEDSLVPLAQKLLRVISEPIAINGNELNITGSMGISFYPNDAKDVEDLLRNADTAMYQAKDLGRNNFQFYTAEMNKRVQHRLVMEHAMRMALEKNELECYYQPCLDLQGGNVLGVEALLRWHHPEMGDISPAEFIPLAEEIGLIGPIGEMVLRTACLQQKAWLKQGIKLRMAVNVSGKQLKQDDFSMVVKKILKETAIDPKNLEIELTESVLLDNIDKTLDVLHELHKMGVNIVIDDFGTGYSSLSYLSQLPVNKIKIDKSFIANLIENANDKAIALTIIALAKNLKMKVLAEGVETIEQADFLRQNGCDEVQGFYYGRPVNKDDLTRWAIEKIQH